jgi:hypothetical protein
MSKASDLNVLTGEQRSILLAVFRDCKDYYHNRRDYDSDYQSLSRASLDELYNGWKSFNSQLASGSMEVTVPVITRFPFSVARSTSDSVRAIRQVLGLFTRLEGFCDSDPALSAYRQRVSAARAKLPDVYVEVARSLVKAWLGPAPSLLDLRPQHGPGAVAEGYKQWEKAHFKYTFRQLRPYGAELLYLNGRHLAEEPRNLQELRHPITRVICVPKDFSKPRIISAEPCVMQFLQQGVARYMMSVLEQRCPYLNFRDQSVNAILSKKWDAVATLDMSDASDTVSRRIVRQLFPADWADLVFSLRSHFAELPDGTRVPLRAFAPMGSALCFPVESVIFPLSPVRRCYAWMEENGSQRRGGNTSVSMGTILLSQETRQSMFWRYSGKPGSDLTNRSAVQLGTSAKAAVLSGGVATTLPSFDRVHYQPCMCRETHAGYPGSYQW